MEDLDAEQMADLQTFRKLRDAVSDFCDLPHQLFERIPIEVEAEMGLDNEDWDMIFGALRAEITEKIHAAMDTILSVLREHRKERTDSWWEGYVLGCFNAGRMDLIASSPAAERASARLQAESLLRKDKPPE